MRVIIAGGRNFNNLGALLVAIQQSGFDISEIVSGGARGADTLAILYAHAHDIPLRVFPADWKRYGKSAGFRRNAEMANYADALIALPGGRGTAHMIELARKRGLKIYVAPKPEH